MRQLRQTHRVSNIAFSLDSEKQFQIADTLWVDKLRSQITQSNFEQTALTTHKLNSKMRQLLRFIAPTKLPFL
ncbi:hypothetical protein UF06_14430 [Vibrio sp. S234-5]|nr:hypothetical protein UF06_14430 [Vibrio sp. S234-5]